MHKEHFPGMAVLNKTLRNVMITRQEYFAASLTKNARHYGEKRELGGPENI